MNQNFLMPGQSAQASSSVVCMNAAEWHHAGSVSAVESDTIELTEFAGELSGLWRGVRNAIALQTGAGVILWWIISAMIHAH